MKTEKIFKPDDGEPLDGVRDFSGVIEAASAVEGTAVFRFSPGVYHFYPDRTPKREIYMSNTDSAEFPQKQCGVYLEGKKGLSFIGEGAAFVFHGGLTALAFVDCEDLLFSGIDLDYECPSTVDVTIAEAAETAGKTTVIADYPAVYEADIAGKEIFWRSERSPYTGESYWVNGAEGSRMLTQRYEAKTGRVYRTGEGLLCGAESVRAEGPGRLRIVYNRIRDISPGDCFQIRNTKRDGCGVFMERCKNVRFENLRVGYLYAFGVLAQVCEDITWESVSFRPWKPGRMSSAAADNLHFSNCRGRIVVRNCDFKNPHDDPVNIHGVFLQLESREGRRAVLKFMHSQCFGFPCVFKGDELQFYDALKLLPQEGLFRVLEVCPPQGDRYRIAVTLDREPRLPEDRIIAVENRSWLPDALISGCRFEQIPTRGLLITTGGKAAVRDNLFIHTAMSGVYISGDARNWFESGPVRDLVIERNIFEDCGDYAVWVDPTNTEFSEDPAEKTHRNIVIRENVVSGCRFPAISIKSSGGVIIKNNVFVKRHNDTADFLRNINSEIESGGNAVALGNEPKG
ncbi:MAG: right-handed parallel beta-helix repeat-containing protein [Treponema sp.]|jgi:parallel beta-helix repeat protein|nr:right-handed parallel beta-helix repeat-containing protein [Treponema sp.]